MKVGTSSPKREGGTQIAQINNAPKVSGGSPHYNNGSIYSTSNLKGIMQSSSVSSPSSGLGRSTTLKKLSASKSDQDLASLRSPHSADSCATVDLASPPRLTGPRVSAPNVKPNGPRTSAIGSFKVSGSSPWATTTISEAPDFAVGPSSNLDAVTRHDKRSRKRTVSDMLNLIPSLQCLEHQSGFSKRRKIMDSGFNHQTSPQALISSEMIGKTEGYSYASLIAEANKGNAPSSIYFSALLHVVRHCSLCIKHARLSSQMDALDIPYVEEVGLRNASSNLWFRLPFARGDTWQHICLRLGRPGSMYWDVKINDQHFRDLWELQKGSNSTPWGSGVRIANTSDVDSHIRYDPEGVVLSYQSVEADSIKKLVADIQRLSNARMFALGMQKLLGVRPDEKLEEDSANADGKATARAKSALEASDKFLE